MINTQNTCSASYAHACNNDTCSTCTSPCYDRKYTRPMMAYPGLGDNRQRGLRSIRGTAPRPIRGAAAPVQSETSTARPGPLRGDEELGPFRDAGALLTSLPARERRTRPRRVEAATARPGRSAGGPIRDAGTSASSASGPSLGQLGSIRVTPACSSYLPVPILHQSGQPETEVQNTSVCPELNMTRPTLGSVHGGIGGHGPAEAS